MMDTNTIASTSLPFFLMHQPIPIVGPHSWPSACKTLEIREDRDRLTIGAHLLEEKLRGVRDSQLGHLLGAFAVRAPAVVPHKTTLFTRVDFELVRGDHETLQEELGSPIADQAIAFHLTET